MDFTKCKNIRVWFNAKNLLNITKYIKNVNNIAESAIYNKVLLDTNLDSTDIIKVNKIGNGIKVYKNGVYLKKSDFVYGSINVIKIVKINDEVEEYIFYSSQNIVANDNEFNHNLVEGFNFFNDVELLNLTNLKSITFTEYQVNNLIYTKEEISNKTFYDDAFINVNLDNKEISINSNTNFDILVNSDNDTNYENYISIGSVTNLNNNDKTIKYSMCSGFYDFNISKNKFKNKLFVINDIFENSGNIEIVLTKYKNAYACIKLYIYEGKVFVKEANIDENVNISDLLESVKVFIEDKYLYLYLDINNGTKLFNDIDSVVVSSRNMDKYFEIIEGDANLYKQQNNILNGLLFIPPYNKKKFYISKTDKIYSLFNTNEEFEAYVRLCKDNSTQVSFSIKSNGEGDFKIYDMFYQDFSNVYNEINMVNSEPVEGYLTTLE